MYYLHLHRNKYFELIKLYKKSIQKFTNVFLLYFTKKILVSITPKRLSSFTSKSKPNKRLSTLFNHHQISNQTNFPPPPQNIKKSLNSTINQSINPKNSVQSISSSNQRFNSQKPLQPLKTQANPPFSLNISIKTPKCFIKFKEKLISKKNFLIKFFNKKSKTFKLTENVHFSTVEIFKPCFVFF